MGVLLEQLLEGAHAFTDRAELRQYAVPKASRVRLTSIGCW